jgi:hypothetical protein
MTSCTAKLPKKIVLRAAKGIACQQQSLSSDHFRIAFDFGRISFERLPKRFQ